MAMLPARIILAGGFGLVLAYLVARMFVTPAKWALKSVVNVAIAVVVIWTWDRVMGATGFLIGLHPVTAGVVGVLGIPGFLLVLAARALIIGW